MRPSALALAALMLLATGCKAPDPKSVSDQIEVLNKEQSLKARLKAVENLREIGSRDAVPGLLGVLPSAPPALTAAIARLLGELRDPTAVVPLCDALNFAAGTSDQEANTANKEIARALRDLDDARAVKPLITLLRRTPDNYVLVEAIGALGALKAPEAVEQLAATATDDRYESFINKKALLALNEINSPDALPTYLRMLFYERRGASFFPESSLGIFRLGHQSIGALLPVLKQEDEQLYSWAKEQKILPAAMVAKTAQLVGDLAAEEAVPTLLKLLQYRDEAIDSQYFVRMAAADALGRMRAGQAARPLAALLGDEEIAARGAYIRALVQIGEGGLAMGRLQSCAAKDHWLLRDLCLYGIAMLAPAKDVRLFDGYEKNAKRLFDKDCNDYLLFGEIDCALEGKKDFELQQKALAGYRKTLEVAAACKSDVACLSEALKNDEPRVRERAAYELGRKGGKEVIAPLVAALQRPLKDEADLAPRFAAILGLDWATQKDAEARAEARASISAFEEQIKTESKKRLTQRTAEDLQRLLIKLNWDAQ